MLKEDGPVSLDLDQSIRDLSVMKKIEEMEEPKKAEDEDDKP